MIELFGMSVPYWQLYISLGIVFCAMEIFIPGFVVLPIGLAFFVTAGAASLGAEFSAQIITLALASFGITFYFQKFVHKSGTEDLLTNADSLVGQTALVSEIIDNEKNQGYVKLYGDRWRALSANDQIIEVGEKVSIEKLDGNKVIVRKH